MSDISDDILAYAFRQCIASLLVAIQASSVISSYGNVSACSVIGTNASVMSSDLSPCKLCVKVPCADSG